MKRTRRKLASARLGSRRAAAQRPMNLDWIYSVSVCRAGSLSIELIGCKHQPHASHESSLHCLPLPPVPRRGRPVVSAHGGLFQNHGYSDIRVLAILNPRLRIRPYFGFPRPVSTTDLSRIFSFPDPETNQAADAAAPAATAMDSCRAHRHRSRARTQRSQRSKARQNPGYVCPPYPARPAHSRASPIAIHGTLAQHVEPCAASVFLHQ
jgi:hypothetical protein